MKNRSIRTAEFQRGAALMIALVMLLVMSMLGLSSMRGTTLEERMAGNWRDQNLAFQAAEAALREGEVFINAQRVHPIPCGDITNTGCGIYQFDGNSPATQFLLSADNDEKQVWQDAATSYSEAISGVDEKPFYLIEERVFLRDRLNVGFGEAEETGRQVYQITASATGQSVDGVRNLQTILLKRYK